MLRSIIGFASRLGGLLLIFVGPATAAHAAVAVPEIDPATASGAIALLAGAAMIARDKFRVR